MLRCVESVVDVKNPGVQNVGNHSLLISKDVSATAADAVDATVQVTGARSAHSASGGRYNGRSHDRGTDNRRNRYRTRNTAFGYSNAFAIDDGMR